MASKPQNPPRGEPQNTASEKKPRGKPFTGKDDPRARQNVEKSFSADTVDTLAAMRHVVAQPPSGDRTHQQRSMREWKSTSPASFFGRLAELEKAELAAKPAPDPAVPGKPVNWSGVGECPTCGSWHSKNANGPDAGPEFMQAEWEQVLKISRHQDAIERVLPYIDEFDAWLAKRNAGQGRPAAQPA